MAHQAAGAAAASGNPEAHSFPLIGLEGAKYVSETLASLPPQVAIRTIQNTAGLQTPLCASLLGMVDQLGISRYEAYRGILLSAKHALLSKVAAANPTNDRLKLERLLNNSFKYLGIQELREVPLAVMEKLDQVPPVFLKQLALDKQIFRELPAKVQRQVWEFDKNLLQADALPPVGQYKYEVATVMRAMAMDEFLSAVLEATAAARKAAEDKGAESGRAVAGPLGLLDAEDDSQGGPRSSGRGSGQSGRSSAGLPALRPVTRKILRKGSFVVQLLRGMVGSSPKIYHQIVELCIVKYRDSDGLYMGHKECSYCTLRTQLLMALHDMNSPVATRDKCHELAWTLDAGITNGHLTEKHLQKLTKYFDDLERGESEAAEKAQAAKRRRLNDPAHVQDEAESAGNVVGGGAGGVITPYRVMGDAAAVLRDPSAMHLLAGAVLQMILPAALQGTLPSDLAGLPPILRMMALGVEGRQMLRDNKYRFPEADTRIMKDLLPLLATWALLHEANPSPPADQLVGTDLPDGWGVKQAAITPVLELLPRNEVARRLTQTFALERLLARDWLGCARTCKLLASALKTPAVLEGWDFAGAMAQRLSDCVRSKDITPASSVWYYAVDLLLVRAVDAHTQVHEEVLRLLLAAASQLTASELGTYLGMTLEHSRKSRRRLSKKPGGFLSSLADFPSLALAGEMGSDIGGSDIGSDGWAGIQQLKLSASDNVRSVYNQFTRLHSVTRDSAPALFAYLAEADSSSK